MIEILILSLKPGRGNTFHQFYTRNAIPLLKKWNFEVLDYGPSRHDEDSYYVIRFFVDLEDRQRSEEAYYQSQDWRDGPREELLAMVEHYSIIVVPEASLTSWSGFGNERMKE